MKPTLNLTNLSQNIKVIAITGGPCSGKTTAMKWLEGKLGSMGHKVVIVPETATELIRSGVPIDENFQLRVFTTSLANEEKALRLAQQYVAEGRHKVVVLCDRGLCDGEAYMGKTRFAQMIAGQGFTHADICDLRYHAVIHLHTAALGAEQYYTLANNTARSESPDEARMIDARTLDAWRRHPHPRVIDNSTDFQGKLDRLLAEISAVIGDPPLEIERRYLIEPIQFPDQILMTSHTVEITQDYLDAGLLGENPPRHNLHMNVSGPDVTHRVRRRVDLNGTTYSYTCKYTNHDYVRTELEHWITEHEYNELLKHIDQGRRSVRKNRTSFFHRGDYVEVDTFHGLFQNSDGLASSGASLTIMEVELRELHQVVEIPPFVKVIKDITDISVYNNYSLANW